jgi:hypothetical protein
MKSDEESACDFVTRTVWVGYSGALPMTEYHYKSPFNLTVTDLHLAARPRVVSVTFAHNDALSVIHFDNPRPLVPLTEIVDTLVQFRIVDRNATGVHLEFGRFEVEVWDEDNPIARFDIDGYRIDDSAE